MTYRQMATDLGIAILLAAPTLTLARPSATQPSRPAAATALMSQLAMTDRHAQVRS